MEPLSVSLIWNKDDYEYIEIYVEHITKMLTRDLSKPFSRNINLPIFYYSNLEKNKIPPFPNTMAEKNIIYIFIGTNSVVSNDWEQYVDKLFNIKNAQVILIALDKYAFSISNKAKRYNFIREYEFTNCKEQKLFISMAHEIYRYGFNEKQEIISKESALKIFLSHTKEGESGLLLADKLKNLIDNSVMQRFFDTNDIAPGYRFDDEIINNVKESSMIIINSDNYSARYWCQREIEIAKEYERPMIEVDLVQSTVDRKFPYAGNIPVIRVNNNKNQLERIDLYRVLEGVIIETIRFNYANRKLKKLEKQMHGKVKKMCRPPEMIDLPKIIKKSSKLETNYNTIIYPDPPVYSEEIKILKDLGVDAYTPIEHKRNTLNGKRVGISISDPEKEELYNIGQNNLHLLRLSQSLANYLLSRGATLIYGGDLRKNGYTEQLLEEAEILKNRLRDNNIYLKNYIAWPIYLDDTKDVKKWKAKYKELLEMKEISIEEEVSKFVKNDGEFLLPNTIQNNYIWAKCLSKMRYEMIRECDARICAGGKKFGYKGKMPGVLEEIIIGIELGKPMYLLGGFGGIVHDVCQLLQYNKCEESLTEQWQKLYNKDYDEVLEKYKKEGEEIDYNKIQNILKNAKLNNGLTKAENETLFNTVFVDEAIELILKGLQSI